MQDVELLGVFIHSFHGACVNLSIIAPDEAGALVGTDPGGWYPADVFQRAVAGIGSRFPNFEPILERIGAEMMRLWYEHGPGKSIASRGVEFLRYQTGSEGYHSVVRGPAARVGAFALEELDEARGVARVYSTTPFPRTMERGVLAGGMGLPGDLVYIDVNNSSDPSRFEIRFH